jgi:chorismate lyase/3-hydroxybenzoate synthase
MSAPEPVSQACLPAALHLQAEAPAAGARVRFTAPQKALVAAENADFTLPLELLDGPGDEIWWLLGARPEVLPEREGIRAVAGGGLLFCEAFTAEATDPQAAAREMYRSLLTYLEDSAYPHIVKGWNYLADINEGAGDDERYKRFCLGRGEALDLSWRQDYLPAGTGVGSDPGTGLRVSLLASGMRPQLVENPRQVSAYRYPRQYGPKSPSFSRAATIGEDRRCLFISGTAAIVGHDSLHESSLAGQVQETLRNWSSLFDAYEAQGRKRPSLHDNAWYRIYLRHAEHLEEARALLREAGLPLHRTNFLRADICRRELLFEMDGTLQLG